jgi:hypothetical protein
VRFTGHHAAELEAPDASDNLHSVLLFKRLFGFKRLRNKRRTERHALAAGFPLKASVSLLGVDDPVKSTAPAGLGQSWGGAVADMSGEGMSLRLPPAAATARGERSILTLALEEFELRIPCTIMHFRTQSAGALCGISLQFADEVQRQGYLQLLEAVVIGGNFAADKPAKAKEGPVTERYRSTGKTVLTVWRLGAGGPISSFDLVMGGHCVRGEAGRPMPEVLTAAEPRAAIPAGAEKKEVLRLFRLVAANLPKSLPADLRTKLQALAKPAPPPTRR